MKINFKVNLIDYKSIDEIPQAWTNKDYKALLEQLEVGDISEIPEEELKEMCQIALTDFETEDAAKEVLIYLLDQDLSKGQIDNLAYEMEEEPMWEEFADMEFHEAIFNANQLLYTAYNGKFPKPEAVFLTIGVESTRPEGKEYLQQPTEAFLLRLLSGGMDEHSALIRLFEDELLGNKLPDAENIIWKFTKVGNQDNTAIFEIIGSTYWLAAFKNAIAFETEAHPDEVALPV